MDVTATVRCSPVSTLAPRPAPETTVPCIASLFGESARGGNVNDTTEVSPSAHPNVALVGTSARVKFAHVACDVAIVAANVPDPPPVVQPVTRPCAVIV